MRYQVFYGLSDHVVSSLHPLEMNMQGLKELLDRLGPEDYIGLLDEEARVLQILQGEAPGQFWVELPLDAAKASYGKFMNRDELETFLHNLPKAFEVDQIPGLRYKPW